jgi:hypothetical protein
MGQQLTVSWYVKDKAKPSELEAVFTVLLVQMYPIMQLHNSVSIVSFSVESGGGGGVILYLQIKTAIQ